MTEEKKDFKDYNLKFELLRGLYNSGYEEPTNVQKKILIDLSNSKDILINCPSLTGKKNIIYNLFFRKNISNKKGKHSMLSSLSYKRICFEN